MAFIKCIENACLLKRRCRSVAVFCKGSLLLFCEFDDEWFTEAARERAICHSDRCSRITRTAANIVRHCGRVAEKLNVLRLGRMQLDGVAIRPNAQRQTVRAVE